MNKKNVPREIFFEDVKMQMIARKWAAKYNDFNPPKKIDFLTSYVLELVDRVPEIVTCGLEQYPSCVILLKFLFDFRKICGGSVQKI